MFEKRETHIAFRLPGSAYKGTRSTSQATALAAFTKQLMLVQEVHTAVMLLTKAVMLLTKPTGVQPPRPVPRHRHARHPKRSKLTTTTVATTTTAVATCKRTHAAAAENE